MDHVHCGAVRVPQVRLSRWLCVAVMLALMAGCATPAVQRQAPQLKRDAGATPTIVLMPLDVELSALTAGGLEQPNAEWTEAAHAHMQAALEERAKAHQVRLVNFESETGADEDRDAGLALVALHRAVGMAALIHHYMPGNALPSKAGKFDWSLGPSAAAIARSHEADYALFLFVRDSYATAGRVAVIVVGALLGVGVPGGAQVGFATVVDLKTGDIVWFNRLVRPHGDLRTPEAAEETVKALVSDAMQ
jgi:hypothetical protein